MGKKNLKDKSALKREIVTKERKEDKKTTIVGLAVAALAVAIAGFFIFAGGAGGFKAVTAEAGVVRIPVGEVDDGKAHFFKYTDGGKEIGFFLVRGSDGAIHTAFDACDVCFREKKGYVQDGDFMICRNCNKKFAIVRIGPHAVGGCNPSYLPHTEANGNAVFSVADLKAGARYF